MLNKSIYNHTVTYCFRRTMAGRRPCARPVRPRRPGCRRCGSLRSKEHDKGRCPTYARTTAHCCQACDRQLYHKIEDCQSPASTAYISNKRGGYVNIQRCHGNIWDYKRIIGLSLPLTLRDDKEARDARASRRQDIEEVRIELIKRRQERTIMERIYPTDGMHKPPTILNCGTVYCRYHLARRCWFGPGGQGCKYGHGGKPPTIPMRDTVYCRHLLARTCWFGSRGQGCKYKHGGPSSGPTWKLIRHDRLKHTWDIPRDWMDGTRERDTNIQTILRVQWRARGWQRDDNLATKTKDEREEYMDMIRKAYRPLIDTQGIQTDEEYLSAARGWTNTYLNHLREVPTTVSMAAMEPTNQWGPY